jgi:hypothetical protein
LLSIVSIEDLGVIDEEKRFICSFPYLFGF